MSLEESIGARGARVANQELLTQVEEALDQLQSSFDHAPRILAQMFPTLSEEQARQECVGREIGPLAIVPGDPGSYKNAASGARDVADGWEGRAECE